MATYPLINGVKHDWASVEISLGSTGINIGIKELTYQDSLEPGIARGTRPEKLARTLGQYDASGKLTMFLQDYHEFITNLGDGYLAVSFDVTINYAPFGSPVLTDVLHGCRIKTQPGGGSQGTDPLECGCDIDIMWIERSGIKPLPNMLV